MRVRVKDRDMKVLDKRCSPLRSFCTCLCLTNLYTVLAPNPHPMLTLRCASVQKKVTAESIFLDVLTDMVPKDEDSQDRDFKLTFKVDFVDASGAPTTPPRGLPTPVLTFQVWRPSERY